MTRIKTIDFLWDYSKQTIKIHIIEGKIQNFNIVIKCHSMKNQYYN